jgi:hypothetical protein
MTSDEVQVSDQQALVIELMQALESGVHGNALRRFFHDEAEQIEYPSLVDPRVGNRGLDGMIAARPGYERRGHPRAACSPATVVGWRGDRSRRPRCRRGR